RRRRGTAGRRGLPEPPPPPPAATVAAPLQFRGANYNETLGRSGSLLLVITRRRGDAVTVRFESSGGLIGAGELEGRLTEDGRLTASGTLLMGRNPFVTDLEALVLGDVMNGTAHYARLVEPGLRTSATRSQFRLTRF
ncbi:MAG: hypothetical protein K2X11_20380, partial [Acetobacteraceae bacterium]|nr:hypothetical protein [Acetobacteraceae bacterium]